MLAYTLAVHASLLSLPVKLATFLASYASYSLAITVSCFPWQLTYPTYSSVKLSSSKGNFIQFKQISQLS